MTVVLAFRPSLVGCCCAALGETGSWPEILSDLDALTETTIAQDGKRFLLRSAPRAAAGLALRAAGVSLPPTVRHVAD